MRPSWKGYLKLSLVSIPVAAISASEPAARPQLNQLHETCHSRIRYQKTCPIHGQVSKDEIVSGFEYAKGEYVVLRKEELEAILGDQDREISIEVVVKPGTVDPIYYTERSYYLVPDEKVGLKPFVLLHRCLADGRQEAVAQGVLFGRKELLLVRPVGDVFAVTALKYAAEVRPAEVAGPVEEPPLQKQEIALTKTLVASYAAEPFDLARYTDRSAAELSQLIEAKVQGLEVVRPPAAKAAPVVNLMEALRKSVAANVKRQVREQRQRRKSG